MVDIISTGPNAVVKRVRIEARVVDTGIKVQHNSTVRDCEVQNALVGIEAADLIAEYDYQSQLIEGNKLVGCYTSILSSERGSKISDNHIYISNTNFVVGIKVSGDRAIVTSNVFYANGSTETFPACIHLDEVTDFVVQANILRHTE